MCTQNLHLGKDRREHNGSSGPAPLFKQGHPQALGTGLCLDRFGISPVGETPQPLWAATAESLVQKVSSSSHSGGTSVHQFLLIVESLVVVKYVFECCLKIFFFLMSKCNGVVSPVSKKLL